MTKHPRNPKHVRGEKREREKEKTAHLGVNPHDLVLALNHRGCEGSGSGIIGNLAAGTSRQLRRVWLNTDKLAILGLEPHRMASTSFLAGWFLTTDDFATAGTTRQN